MSVKQAIQHSVNVARNIQHNVDKPRQKKTTSQQGKWFVQANRLKGLVHMDKACDVTCLQNKRKCKQRFAFTVAMTSREYTLFAIFTLPKIQQQVVTLRVCASRWTEVCGGIGSQRMQQRKMAPLLKITIVLVICSIFVECR